ncbi:unnamed protein product [Nezara viridula]|uniref:SNRNP25 ubiquitin-like domain-containing protein n=1 Tax=Nezara viridula TaxID=85310 RepID=A0A9P0E6P4_NEZVI|nr:unnamed protein product [Nezara viridula]
MNEDEDVNHSFSRDELMEITKKTIADLIQNDPLLRDLPKDVTLEEVTNQLALEHGQSMTIFLHKENGDTWPIVVPIKATVLDLKRAIRRYTTLWLDRSGFSSHLSWKYVWRNNVLVSAHTKLDDDNKKLSDIGLSNKCSVSFMKRLRQKNCSKCR